ncbi:mucin-3A-like isoform X2 [Cimex lectularius]|uniref:Tetraspanin n=1 Tax=Cimex lectularius TaxID=79782 RepID=A0A8I6SBP8_CIMLE|nr:mucin-3A-like isoform X2 [Cimex lectularius]
MSDTASNNEETTPVQKKMDCGSLFAKYVLCLFNLIIFILGAVVLATGVWLYADKSSLLSFTRLVHEFPKNRTRLENYFNLFNEPQTTKVFYFQTSTASIFPSTTKLYFEKKSVEGVTTKPKITTSIGLRDPVPENSDISSLMPTYSSKLVTPETTISKIFSKMTEVSTATPAYSVTPLVPKTLTIGLEDYTHIPTTARSILEILPNNSTLHDPFSRTSYGYSALSLVPENNVSTILMKISTTIVPEKISHVSTSIPTYSHKPLTPEENVTSISTTILLDNISLLSTVTPAHYEIPLVPEVTSISHIFTNITATTVHDNISELPTVTLAYSEIPLVPETNISTTFTNVTAKIVHDNISHLPTMTPSYSEIPLVPEANIYTSFTNVTATIIHDNFSDLSTTTPAYPEIPLLPETNLSTILKNMTTTIVFDNISHLSTMTPSYFESPLVPQTNISTTFTNVTATIVHDNISHLSTMTPSYSELPLVPETNLSTILKNMTTTIVQGNISHLSAVTPTYPELPLVPEPSFSNSFTNVTATIDHGNISRLSTVTLAYSEIPVVAEATTTVNFNISHFSPSTHTYSFKPLVEKTNVTTISMKMNTTIVHDNISHLSTSTSTYSEITLGPQNTTNVHVNFSTNASSETQSVPETTTVVHFPSSTRSFSKTEPVPQTTKFVQDKFTRRLSSTKIYRKPAPTKLFRFAQLAAFSPKWWRKSTTRFSPKTVSTTKATTTSHKMSEKFLQIDGQFNYVRYPDNSMADLEKHFTHQSMTTVQDYLIKMFANTNSQEHDDKKLEHTFVLAYIAYILIIAGAIIFFIGIIGYCAALRESRCLLGFYGVLILIVLILEITAAGLSYVYKDRVEEEIQDFMMKTIKDYDPDMNHTVAGDVSRAWDVLMLDMECCGVTNYTDFQLSEKFKNSGLKVPRSCCKTANVSNKADLKCMHNPDVTNANIVKGCYDAVIDELKLNYTAVIYIVIAIVLIQFLLTLLSFCLCNTIDPYDK